MQLFLPRLCLFSPSWVPTLWGGHQSTRYHRGLSFTVPLRFSSILHQFYLLLLLLLLQLPVDSAAAAAAAAAATAVTRGLSISLDTALEKRTMLMGELVHTAYV